MEITAAVDGLARFRELGPVRDDRQRVGVSRGSLQGWQAGLNYSLPTPTPGSSEVGDEGLEPPAFRM